MHPDQEPLSRVSQEPRETHCWSQRLSGQSQTSKPRPAHHLRLQTLENKQTPTSGLVGMIWPDNARFSPAIQENVSFGPPISSSVSDNMTQPMASRHDGVFSAHCCLPFCRCGGPDLNSQCYAVLLTGEQLTLGEIATDYVEMLLLSGAMVASAVVVQQIRNRESDSTAMRAELNKTSLAGKQWRPETNPCVTQKRSLFSANPQRTDKHIFGAKCGSVAT